MKIGEGDQEGYLERKILVGEKKGSCIYLPQNNFDEN